MRSSSAPWVLLLLLTTACGEARSPGKEPLVVFAAASLQELVDAAGTRFETREGIPVVHNFAGSNVLAQQILAAPKADVFLSADLAWVEKIEVAGRTVEGSRQVLFSNRLVVVARRETPFEIDSLRDLAAFPMRHLALADPQAVPAGRYARAHLERVTLGEGTLWDALAPRVAPALNVRAALALAESDEEILAIVYQTDARTSENVAVLFTLPSIPEVSITYHGVLVRGGQNPEAGRRFLDFLSGPEGRELARGAGFLTVEGAS